MNSIDAVAVEKVPPRDPKPRVWHLAVLFALSETIPIGLAAVAIAFLSAAGVMAAAEVPMTRLHLRQLLDTPGGALVAMACVAVVCLALAIAAGAGSPVPIAKRLRMGRGLFSMREIAVASVGGLALSSTIGTFLRFVPGYESGGIGRFHKLCAGLEGSGLVFAFVLVGLVAPIGEELFYRGAMQTRLMERYGVRTGLAATSVVFGAAHLDPLHIALGVVMGLYLGWISILSGSCRTTIAVHAVNNTFAVLAAVLAGASHKAVSREPLDYAVSAVVSLLVAVGCMRWLGRRYSNLP